MSASRTRRRAASAGLLCAIAASVAITGTPLAAQSGRTVDANPRVAQPATTALPRATTLPAGTDAAARLEAQRGVTAKRKTTSDTKARRASGNARNAAPTAAPRAGARPAVPPPPVRPARKGVTAGTTRH